MPAILDYEHDSFDTSADAHNKRHGDLSQK
jgi:hypothetical protein